MNAGIYRNISGVLFFFWVLFLAGPAYAGPDTPCWSGNEVLKKVIETYAECSSFYCEGVIISKVTHTGSHSEPEVGKSVFKAWYQRPFLFRMDWEENDSEWDSAWSLYFDKDKRLYVIDCPFRDLEGARRLSETHASLDDAINRSKNASAGLTYFIPKLMENKSVYFDIYGCEIMGEEKVNGRMCVILYMHNSMMGDWTLWADKKNFVIRKFQETSFLPDSAMQDVRHIERDPSSLDSESVESGEKPGEELEVPLFSMSGRSYSLTVEFTELMFNREMTEDDFYYPGPKAVVK